MPRISPDAPQPNGESAVRLRSFYRFELLLFYRLDAGGEGKGDTERMANRATLGARHKHHSSNSSGMRKINSNEHNA